MTSIQSEFERRFAGLPGVLGIGLGKGEGGEYELKVYVVDAHASEPFPKKFQDARVSVEVTGKITAH